MSHGEPVLGGCERRLATGASMDDERCNCNPSANRRRESSKASPSFLPLLIPLGIFILLGFCGRHFSNALSRPTSRIKRTDGVTNNTPKIVSDARADLPPIDELISQDGTTIIGDISWMLDFAIIAFPKSGTTFMKDHLNKTEETYVYDRELCMKRDGDVADFVRIYYDLHAKMNQPKYGKSIQFGLKCPGVFYRDDIHIYRRYFPRTKFIIGLRHPISWFESFYNYQSYRGVKLPNDTSQLIGKCVDHEKVCTDRARFHAALARLGKTPMSSQEEINLLFGLRYDGGEVQNQPRRRQRYLKQQTTGVPNKVLLYEVRQIHDAGASKELLSDIRSYLGIREDFLKISPYKQSKLRAINICDEQHESVRKLLVEHGADARAWMKSYFLKNPSVEVVASASFHRYIGDWGTDQCLSNS